MRQTLFGLLLLSFWGCSSTPHNPPYEKLVDAMNSQAQRQSNLVSVKDIPQFEDTKELVAPGFLFSIDHPSDEKLSGRFRINPEGIILLPYNVRIDTTDLTLPELKERVLKSFASFFQRGVQDFKFALVEKKYYVEVRGLVKNSGRYLVDRKESIDKVIDKAGGLNGDIKRDFFAVAIKQRERSYSISLNQYYENNVFANSFTWTGRDSLFIKPLNEEVGDDSVPTVTVLGGVQTPGKVLYQSGAPIFYYLTKSGGVISTLGYQEAYVLRHSEQGLARIQFDITKPETIPTIKPHDVILLNTEKRTLTDKFFDRLVQVSAVLSTIAFFIIAF